MTIYIQDLVLMFLATIFVNVLMLAAVGICIYSHLTERLDNHRRMIWRDRNHQKVVDGHITEFHTFMNDQLAKQVVEDVSPPPLAEDFIGTPKPDEFVDQMAPMATPVVPAEYSHYHAYMDAHRQLWKLQTTGEDDTEYAEYLRGVMAECYSKMDGDQKDAVERESADAWRHV